MPRPLRAGAACWPRVVVQTAIPAPSRPARRWPWPQTGPTRCARASAITRSPSLSDLCGQRAGAAQASTILAGSLIVHLHPDRPQTPGQRSARGRLHALPHPPGPFPDADCSARRASIVALAAGLASTNGPAGRRSGYRAPSSPPPAKGGFLRQEFDSGLNAARGDLAVYIAPGKGDRFLQWVYGRLPYHPQHIEKGTSVDHRDQAADLDSSRAARFPSAGQLRSGPQARISGRCRPVLHRFISVLAADTGTWIVQGQPSRLHQFGDNFQVRSAHHRGRRRRTHLQLQTAPSLVPQGATLIGEVTRAQPARCSRPHRVLSFSFSQSHPAQQLKPKMSRLVSPEPTRRRTSPSTPKARPNRSPRTKSASRLFLALMAARPLDQGQAVAASRRRPDTLGRRFSCPRCCWPGDLVGTVVGLAAGGSPYVAAGIGYWGAGRASSIAAGSPAARKLPFPGTRASWLKQLPAAPPR